ncbi:MAG TPA: thiamine phosphate synthase [Pyrinomonadaceae bacterium]|nr:thiamine phosphate synthase [Pyrinomonadaceae bacterium]
MIVLPKVYPLTDVTLTGLSHAEQVRRLAEGGASIIQLREKTMAAREFYEEARIAQLVARQYSIKLIINDRADIAAAIGADGVHLGQDDLPVSAAREMLGPKAIIGLSTHNLGQAQEAVRLPVDYIAVGPIFSTVTKADTAQVLGLAGLKAIRQEVGEVPLVAIGGISVELARQVIDAGASAIALINALLAHRSEITARTTTLIQALG